MAPASSWAGGVPDAAFRVSARISKKRKKTVEGGLTRGVYLLYTYMQMKTSPASLVRALQGRRQKLLPTLVLPPEGLPGSLALSHRRCGSPACHCHQGQGHPSWTLTFMVEGKKRVEHVPHEAVEEVRRRVGEGNAFKSGVAELMAINAQLMVLKRREARAKTRAAR